MKRLVLAGGGHAHLETLLHLGAFVDAGAHVTVVSASDYQYYSGMGPGLLSGIYEPRQCRFDLRKMVEDRGGRFLCDPIVSLDGARRRLQLASGERLAYDLLSVNLGSRVRFETASKTAFAAKPIEELMRAEALARSCLAKSPQARFVVAGGGAAGVELAGALWRLGKQSGCRPDILLVAGSEMLSRAPQKLKDLARKSLQARGIGILEGCRVSEALEDRVRLDSGREIPSELCLLATGVRPPELLAESGFPLGATGGLLVNSRLQVRDFPEVFGGGDCVDLEHAALPKVGVFAVRQNPVLRHNLMQSLKGEGKLKEFVPQAAYLLILNMGDGRGIFWKKDRVYEGRLAFRLKDYIDRRFVEKYQVSGEQD